MTELCDLATGYDTDKAPWGWNYTPVYNDWLSGEDFYVQTVVEAGIWKGASLRMWRDFFPVATIYGVDNDINCQLYGEKRITTYWLDAYDPQFATWLASVGLIDLFVDDARHFAEYQCRLLKTVWPHMRPGGVYAIEETFPWEVVHETVSNLPDVERCENIRTVSPSRRWDIISGRYSLTLLRKKR